MFVSRLLMTSDFFIVIYQVFVSDALSASCDVRSSLGARSQTTLAEVTASRRQLGPCGKSSMTKSGGALHTSCGKDECGASAADPGAT